MIKTFPARTAVAVLGLGAALCIVPVLSGPAHATDILHKLATVSHLKSSAPEAVGPAQHVRSTAVSQQSGRAEAGHRRGHERAR